MKSRIVNERNQPIRVLHIVTIMNRGGLETMLMNYYRNIDRKKIQFDFVVHRSEKGAYDDEIMSLGGRILHVPPIQLKNILSYKKTLGAIFIDNPEYRIVHSHIDSLSALPLYIAKKTGVPIRIAHSHNSNFDTDSKKIIRNLAKRLIKYQATDIVGCSTDAIKFMFGNSAKDYRLISNAVDVTQFGFDQKIRIRIRKEFNYNDDDFIVGHVGRFEAQKNHDYLLEIFNEVFRLNNHAKLMLVGDGLLKKQIEAKAKELGISSKVIFTGNRTDVSYLMQAMDVFLMPSLYEGLPVVAIEAQISG